MLLVLFLFNHVSMISNSTRNSRGSSSATGKFENTSSEHLKSAASVLYIESSKYSFNNKSRTKEVLKDFCPKTGYNDAETICESSSTMILNLLSKYCRYGTREALSDDTMGASIQGLRACYVGKGHKGPWTVDTTTG